MIKFGAATETENEGEKDSAGGCASCHSRGVEEGVVPGGGIPLLRAVKALTA
jgi:chaperonin GroEL